MTYHSPRCNPVFYSYCQSPVIENWMAADFRQGEEVIDRPTKSRGNFSASMNSQHWPAIPENTQTIQ
jgi:hypothetical protein